MTECCKIPEIADEKVLYEIEEATSKTVDPAKDPNLFGCVSF